MNRSEYAKYIASDDWKRRREPLIAAHGSRCCLCGIPRVLANFYDGKDLNVHHQPEGYAYVGEEKPEHVEVRCQLCHGREHGVCDARMHRDEDEWCLLDWLVRMFQQKAQPFSLSAPEGLVESYLNAARKRRTAVAEIDIAFAAMWRHSRGHFPNVADFAAEIEAVRIARAA